LTFLTLSGVGPRPARLVFFRWYGPKSVVPYFPFPKLSPFFLPQASDPSPLSSFFPLRPFFLSIFAFGDAADESGSAFDIVYQRLAKQVLTKMIISLFRVLYDDDVDGVCHSLSEVGPPLFLLCLRPSVNGKYKIRILFSSRTCPSRIDPVPFFDSLRPGHPRKSLLHFFSRLL